MFIPMLAKSRGIVLHSVKFGETSLIATIYTLESGRQAFLINASRGSRATNRAVILQPLFIVELDAYVRKTRDIQRMKECRLAHPFTSIPFNLTKSCQVIFLAELLFKILREEESNPDLFAFIENSLLFFDRMETGTSCFYIWFMVRLTGYLGILPNLEDKTEGWFDLRNGRIVSHEPPYPEWMDPETTRWLRQFTHTEIHDLQSIRMSSLQRDHLLSGLLTYFRFHFESMGLLHSHIVLKEVFR